MEFERALFRIHQRTLHADAFRKARLHAERWLPWVIGLCALSLARLHTDYVGQAKCLPLALRRAGLWNTTKDEPAIADDTLISLFVAAGADMAEQDEQILDGSLRLRMEAPSSAASRGDATSAEHGSGLTVAAENVTTVQSGTGSPHPLVGSMPVPDAADTVVKYRFAFDREIILMRPAVLEAHGFLVHNITIQESCLAPSWLLRDLFRLFDAHDNVVINELAYTFRSRGYLERYDGDAKVESWVWSAEQVEAASPRIPRRLITSCLRKVLLLGKAFATFLLISAITGFFIRVAVNGSAVLMFPIAIVAQRYGSGRMSLGLLTRSFPWIGVHVEVLRRAGRPLWPLFRSHLIFLFLQSFAYLSCNLAWRFILYRKSSPEGFEERVFSFCSIVELFNLIFVRSVTTTAIFPKIACATLVYLHFYIYCSLYPFHTLAFATCASCCAYGMAYCLNHFEEPALRGDPFSHTTPTTLHPRALYLPQLSPSWTLESAPLWTMFYPPQPPSAFPDEAMRHLSNEEYLMP